MSMPLMLPRLIVLLFTLLLMSTALPSLSLPLRAFQSVGVWYTQFTLVVNPRRKILMLTLMPMSISISISMSSPIL